MSRDTNRELGLIVAAPLAFGLAWYVIYGIRGTIYLANHQHETSFPVWAAWYPGYSWVSVSIAAACGATAALVVVLGRRLRRTRAG